MILKQDGKDLDLKSKMKIIINNIYYSYNNEKMIIFIFIYYLI